MSLCDWSSDVCSSDLKSFDQLKTLAGTWRGSVKATPPDPEIDNAKLEITLRVTSRGNAQIGRASCRERVENSAFTGCMTKRVCGGRYANESANRNSSD